LNDCGALVDEMKINLVGLQPELEEKSKMTEEIMKKVEIENSEAEK
jgi:hypothetical protein